MALVLAWTLPITIEMIDDGDFPEHLRNAADVAAGKLFVPHFLFFSTVGWLIAGFGLTPPVAGILAITGTHLVGGWLIWRFLQRHAPDSIVTPVVATAALAMAGPVLLLASRVDLYLIGYSPPSGYHNATFIVSKPFCLLLLIAAARIFESGNERASYWLPLAAVGLTAVSKPNYLLCLVPAAALYACVRWPPRRDQRLALLVLVGWAAVVVAAMRLAYFGSESEAVMWAPLVAFGFHTPLGWTLLGKQLAAFAFPLTVVALWPREVARRPAAVLAWIAAAIALAQGSLLAERGSRIDHGNLLVAGPQSMFVLLIASAAVVLAVPPAERGWRRGGKVLAWGVLGLHVLGGLEHVGLKVGPGAFTGLVVVALLLSVAQALAAASRSDEQALAGGAVSRTW